MMMVASMGSVSPVQEFLNELALLQSLFHRSIVPFYGMYQDEGRGVTANGRAKSSRYFLVTKFAERGCLCDHINKPFDEITYAMRKKWSIETAVALEYVPNVLVTEASTALAQ